MVLPQRYSSHRPPLFCGMDYPYWKCRMKMFIGAMNFNLWEIIKNGPFVPTKEENSQAVTKPREELTFADKRRLQLNFKAKHVLLCGLSKDEYEKISDCDSAKDIWDTLDVIYEGTTQVKEARINILMRQYELFEINEMFTRFIRIVNGLRENGTAISNEDKVRKILWTLLKEWIAKVTAIEEAKDLITLRLNELMGSLVVCETTDNDA